jgi:hypothetical protein
MLPVADKLRIEPENENCHARGVLVTDASCEVTREPRGYVVDAIPEFFGSTIAFGSSCLLRGVKLLCEAQIAGYIDARSDG